MVEKLRGRDYAGTYKWLRSYVGEITQVRMNE